MTTTPKFSITDISDQQANAETTHNEAVRLLEAMASRNVVDRDLTTPPGGATDGDAYIVAATGTDDWLGKDNNVAVFVTDGWQFIAPQEGNEVYLEDEDVVVFWSGSAWVARGGMTTLTDAATIAWDASVASNAKVQITTDRAFGAPSNLHTGMIYTVAVQQPSGTTAAVTWNAVFQFAGGSHGSTASASAVDIYSFVYDGTNLQQIGESLNVS